MASGLIVRLFPISAPGFQVYDAAPVAISEEVVPAHTVELLTLIVGEAFTKTEVVCVKGAVQPAL